MKSSIGALAAIAVASLSGHLLGQPNRAAAQADSISWPFNLGDFVVMPAARIGPGEAIFRVTVDAGSVTDVQPLEPRSKSLEAVAQEAIRGWKFSTGSHSSFDVTLRHSLDGTLGCDGDNNQIIRAEWPKSIEVVSRKYISTCDPAVYGTAWKISYPELAGTLVCDCPGTAPLAGVTLTIRRGKDGQVLRTIRTDDSGHFRASGLPPAEYFIRVDDVRIEIVEYQVRLDPSSAGQPLLLPLKPAVVPSPVVLVTAGTIPGYPTRARQAGAKGIIDVRVSLEAGEVLDVDAIGGTPELASAAAANVKTWKFKPAGYGVPMRDLPVLNVKFDYRLVPGDCGRAGGPKVTMTLPRAVVIEAVGPCSPNR